MAFNLFYDYLTHVQYRLKLFPKVLCEPKNSTRDIKIQVRNKLLLGISRVFYENFLITKSDKMLIGLKGGIYCFYFFRSLPGLRMNFVSQKNFLYNIWFNYSLNDSSQVQILDISTSISYNKSIYFRPKMDSLMGFSALGQRPKLGKYDIINEAKG